jgi:HPt (histidine-containing phosphotransfer) domain-containing protein
MSKQPPIFVEMPEGIEELVPEFLSSQKEAARELTQMLARSDWEGIRRIAHDLKGNGTSFGFPLLTEFGAAMGRSLKEADLSSLSEQIERLADYLDRVELQELGMATRFPFESAK